MKVHIQRLTSVLLVLVLCLGLFVFPASAAEETPVTSTGTFWSGLASGSDEFFSGYFDLLGDIVGFTCASVCPISEDRLHHGKVISKGLLSGQWVAKCSYCSDKFTVYDDDMQNAYDSHVGKMQTDYGSTNINAAGLSRYYLTGWSYISTGYLSIESSSSVIPSFSAYLDANRGSGTVHIQGKYISLPAGTYTVYLPVATKSVLLSSDGHCALSISERSISGSSQGIGFSQDYDSDFSVSSSFVARTNFTYCVEFIIYTGNPGESAGYAIYETTPPYIDGVPLFPAGSSIVSTDSRVGNLTGDYGIMGDNGTIIKSDSQYIVNETTSTYTNPATGTTSPITDWTYDYSDRSYNLTLEGGSTTTVTYGDENVTIKEGDTIYNVYYVVPGGGSGGETPPPTTSPTTPPTEHVHDYVSVVTQEPTCISPGLKTNTCSICGESSPEKIPATGHSWTVDRTINTTYDEDGNVLTQGYTIYRCSVCGNEYKDETGSGPPDDGKDDGGGQGFLGWLGEKLGELLGAIGDGILGLIQAALGKILDGLIAIVNMISEKLETVVNVFLDCLDVLPGIFSGFTDFLTAGFAFLPPEVITVITFGILMMVLVAIIKLFLK